MTYIKVINGRQVFSTCTTIQMPNGAWVSNPTPEMISEAGWTEYILPSETVIDVPIEENDTAIEPDLYEIMNAVKKMLSNETSTLSDADALEVAALFPTWASKEGSVVSVGERLWYNEKLYKVIQSHNVQSDWTPDISTSLYTEISIQEIPEWKQPTGASDVYMVDDKVSHNGKTWISIVNNNSWEPGVYGWNEL